MTMIHLQQKKGGRLLPRIIILHLDDGGLVPLERTSPPTALPVPHQDLPLEPRAGDAPELPAPSKRLDTHLVSLEFAHLEPKFQEWGIGDQGDWVSTNGDEGRVLKSWEKKAVKGGVSVLHLPSPSSQCQTHEQRHRSMRSPTSQ
jgi:hypothetical protein